MSRTFRKKTVTGWLHQSAGVNQTWCIQVTTSNKYIRTHQSLIVRLNCSNLAGAILLQILFGLHITVLFNLHGH